MTDNSGSVMLKCIAPLQKSKRVEEDAGQLGVRTTSTRKGSINRLVTSLGDMFVPHEEEKIRALRDGKHESARTDDYPQKLLEKTKELEEERQKTREVQQQLNLAMDLNTELKVSAGIIAEEIAEDEQRRLVRLKTQLKQETAWREQAESACAKARIEIQSLKAALETSAAEKKQLEAELHEAAQDVLQKQKMETALQASSRQGEEFLKLVEASHLESAEAKKKLKQSEEGRRQLEKELTHLRSEATKWEDVLDTLQDQLDAALSQRLGSPALSQRLGSPAQSSIGRPPMYDQELSDTHDSPGSASQAMDPLENGHSPPADAPPRATRAADDTLAAAAAVPRGEDAPPPSLMHTGSDHPTSGASSAVEESAMDRLAPAEGITEWCDRTTEGITECSSGAARPAIEGPGPCPAATHGHKTPEKAPESFKASLLTV